MANPVAPVAAPTLRVADVTMQAKSTTCAESRDGRARPWLMTLTCGSVAGIVS